MPIIPIDQLGPAYCYLDPASGRKETKNTNARTAIVVACHAPPAFILTLYIWAERASTTDITNQIFFINQQFRPAKIAIETAGQQYLLFSTIQDEAIRRGIKLPLVEGTQYTDSAKIERITNALDPLTKQGRLCILSHQTNLKEELIDFPRGATKDILDALSGVISIMPKPQTHHQATSSRQAVLDYLHRSHAIQPEETLRNIFPSLHTTPSLIH